MKLKNSGVETSRGISDEEDDDDDEHDFKDDKDDEDDDEKNDSEETESNNDGDDFVHPNMSTYKAASTPPDYELTDEDENKECDNKDKECEQEQEEEDDLYRDVNINLERSDAEMTDAQANQETDDAHVTLTAEPPVSDSLVNVPVPVAAETPSSAIIKEQVQYEVSKIMPQIEKHITESLETEVLVRSTNQPQTSYAVAASLSEFELKKILIDKMETNKSMNILDIQKDLYNALVESYNTDKDIMDSYGDVVTLKRGRDEQDKDEDPSAGSNRGSKIRRSGKEAESSKEPTHKGSKSTRSSKSASRSQPKSSGKSAHAEEHGQKVDDLENQPQQEFYTGDDDVTLERESRDDDERQWNPSSSPTADRTQSLFNEFLATPIDFSDFIMNRLKIDNLTQEVLTDPTYDLIKGTCKNFVELEYHLDEVFKATNDQLDWHNPKGRSYPHDLSKPLPLIPNERGRQVIPFDHFIHNDLEYLKRWSSSQRYTTSITKTKAIDYGQVKWIEDKKFYGYDSNMESSYDVYSRHRIIAVTNLKIMKWYGYSHLEEIIVRRHDDKLYKFREDDFKRLHRQDIEDMLLLLMDYLPKRKWSNNDKQRVRVMINAIDKKLRDRRLMRNLEKFVGGRHYGRELRGPEVPKYNSESENESWGFSDEEDDDDDEHDFKDDKDDEDDDEKNDSEETESNNDGDDFVHPNMSTYKAASTPPDYELTDEEENKECDNKDKECEQEQEEEDDLYRDVNINLERSDAEMTDAQANQETDDAHVTLTAEPPVSDSLVNVPVPVAAETPSSAIIKEQVQYEVSKIMPQIEKHITESLETEVLVRSTNQPQTSYAVAASLSEFELKKILIDKMETNKSMNILDIQKDLYNALVESYNTDKDIMDSYGDVVTLKRGRDEQDKDEDPSAGSNRGSKRRRSGKEAESSKEPTHKGSKSTRSSKSASRSQPKSSGKSAHAEEHGQKVDDLENQPQQEFYTGDDDVTLERESRDDDERQWNPSSSPTPDRTQSLFNEFLATPIDFSDFIMNRLKIDNLTQEVLTGPTYDLIKGTCKSVVGTRHRIISSTNLKIMKWYGYSHLEEIIVRRHDDKLYKFREGDFKRLRRQDIEDMLLLLVQNKLTNLNLEERQNWRDLPRDIPLDSVEVLRFNTIAGNPVKDILLKLNLPNHRILKDGGEGTKFWLSQIFITTCSYPIDKYKDIMKAQVHVSRLPLL
ncbi:hypothetical protein Tco_1449337 [Tanacetum coccineum]